MKQIYLVIALFFATTIFAQVPQGFSYQAVALNASGNAVASSPVKVRLSILDNSATGTAVYTETHNPTTNNMGLFTLTIGQGAPVTGTFSGINWAQNSKFLKVEIDITNGNNYVLMGTSQLLSVPYAMVAGATNAYLPITTHAKFDTNSGSPRISVSGFIMPTPETLSYTESGFVVGVSLNTTFETSVYHEAGYDYGPFEYAVGGSFSLINDYPAINQNLYIRVYAKTASGQYLYGNEVMVHVP